MNQSYHCSCISIRIRYHTANIKVYIDLLMSPLCKMMRWMRHDNANGWKHHEQKYSRQLNATDRTFSSRRPTMHEPVKSNLPAENKWIHMVRIYHKCMEKRADQFNFTDHSCVEILSLHRPVKSNLLPDNKWMHMVKMYRKWKREQSILISQIIFLCWNAKQTGTSESNLPS